jgi:hypothetical protein
MSADESGTTVWYVESLDADAVGEKLATDWQLPGDSIICDDGRAHYLYAFPNWNLLSRFLRVAKSKDARGGKEFQVWRQGPEDTKGPSPINIKKAFKGKRNEKDRVRDKLETLQAR